jgi:hypothetical protein
MNWLECQKHGNGKLLAWPKIFAGYLIPNGVDQQMGNVKLIGSLIAG